MSNINIFGTGPDQLPTNADLGTMAFQDQEYVTAGNLVATTVDITTEARINRFSTANARITGGNITGVFGTFTVLSATNFSTANGEITGTLSHIGTTQAGAVSRIANVYASLGNFTDFSTGNAFISGGSIGVTAAGAVSRMANVYGTLGNFTDFSTANATITGGSATHLVVTNFSSANAEITSSATTVGVDTAGAVSRVANVYATLGNFSNFSSANANFVSGNITSGNITGAGTSIGSDQTGAVNRVAGVYASLGNFTNFSTGNAIISGGSVTSVTGSASTFVATNFSSGNAQITGGSVTGGTGAFTTLQASSFSSANVFITAQGAIGVDSSGALSRISNVYASLGNFTNFSTGNAIISGGSVTGGTGAFTTLQATNFSSANISITGGNIILGAGTTTVAPLRFSTGGALTSTADAGMLEYTTLFHGTTQGTERGLVLTPQVYVLNADRGLATVTTAQTLFNQTFKVTSSTRYYYQAFISISKTNATANTLQFAIEVAGGAVIAAHEYSVISKVAAARTTLTAPQQMSNRITTGFNTLVAISPASAAAAATFDAHIQGYFDITTGGTINPLIALATNAPTAPTLLAQSYWLMYPVGAISANTSIQ